MITLSPCPKSADSDLDKSVGPAETVRRVREKLTDLNGRGCTVLEETRRVDAGRLGIPVFMSVCGPAARRLLPTRKQMGKGASKEQAEASALMELMERFGFFSFRGRPPLARCTWSEARARFGASLLPLAEILRSTGENLPEEAAIRALDAVSWDFVPVTDILEGKEYIAPVNWFYSLGEFNGSSAGNSPEESILQGACELIERHVCCLVDRDRRPLPTIAQDSITDPVLADLIRRFTDNGIVLVLKDLSLGMPVPTVAALAWDPATWPARSEVVFTAGTATSPVKAAIRAVTEVAQLAGDFITGACYDASGLPKFSSPAEAAWLLDGETVDLASLPALERADIRDELLLLAENLKQTGVSLFAVDTTSPLTEVPTHYCIAPGLQFRERDANASLGLFIGRRLAEEEADPAIALQGLALLDSLYNGAHWLPFFQGLVQLRQGDYAAAGALFETAAPLQPDDEAAALAYFYRAYALTIEEQWEKALPYLDHAVRRSPGMKEYYNLRGVCYFKQEEYAMAEKDFRHVVTHLDKGSVMDIANLGFCHARLGNRDEACKWLRAALELDPDHEKAKETLAQLQGHTA